MMTPPDIRYKAAGRQVAQARQVVFPLSLRVHRPLTVQAIVEVRRIVELLQGAAREAEFPGARLAVLDFDSVEGRDASVLTLQQKSPREVCLHLSFAVSLILDEADDFWSHAAAIAAAADLLQGFALRPHEKGVEVDVQQARTIDSKANTSGAGAVAKPEAGETNS